MGKVYLVGAGCGDLDLYTNKAMKCIQETDCIIYDSLIDDRILEYCKKDCEKIFVGKRANHHAFEQDSINELLCDKAKQYHHVVRLKGGDVYVFGRGGEEGKKLYEEGIDFEVVPGISSAIAGLAYAGIPITHRGLSTGFQVYTGTAKKNQAREFNYSHMLDDACTYVFLMAMAKLESIVHGFIQAGKDIHTPVAVISNASFANQRTLTGTLETIVDLYKQDPLPTPGIIVVGNVVKMREYLNFYETKPLFHKKVLVCVVGHDQTLANELHHYGANVDVVQTGQIEYLDTIIPELKGYLVFTSKHGVIGFMKAFLKQYKDVRKLNDVKIVAIGHKTNQALQEYHLCADLIPDNSNHEGIDALLKEIKEPILLVKGDFESSVTIYTKAITVYRNSVVEITNIEKEYDYAFFTNGSSVERFKQANNSIIHTFVSIGKHTTEKIKENYPDPMIIELSKPDKSKMVEALVNSIEYNLQK